MLVVNDRVRETTATTGTGTITLAGAVTGYQSFAVIGNANTCYYTISDQLGANWEVGIGTYTLSGTTLARTTVLKSSNANALVNFTAGTKDVFVTYPAETAVSGGGGGTYPTIQPSLNLDFANTRQLDPRITFVRNSTAAYYDGQTTAMAEQNLFIRCQEFDNGVWGIIGGTLTANDVVAPDGTTTADSFTTNTGNARIVNATALAANSIVSGNTYTMSVYAKNITGSGVFRMYCAHTVAGFSSDLTATSVWQRFSFTFTANSTGIDTRIAQVPTAGDLISFWGAQLEQRSSATAYTPTTTSAITNYIPVLLSAPAGVARFDCDPITGKSLGLLIEESRTNLLRYSVGNGASWNIRTGALVTTANAQVAPDGTITATQLTKTAITDTAWQQAFTAVVGVTYTASAYFLKTSSVNVIEFAIRLSFTGGDYSGYLSFDTLTGNYVVRSGALANITIVDCGRYWRILITSSGTTSGTLSDSVIIIRPTTGVIVGGFNTTAIGSCIFWGAQLEAGSFATSYMPTVASTVTRAADQASITGTNFSSWYNQSQGTIYSEGDTVSTVNALLALISDGSTSNLLGIGHGASTNTANSYYNSVLQTNFGSLGVVWNINTVGKVILSLSTNNSNAACNGVAGTVDTVCTMPSNVTRLDIGSWVSVSGVQPLNGHIRKLSYYPVALSSANLVALTS
jgi:hypothetical protein